MAGANFIRKSELDSEWESHIRYGPLPSVCDANNKPLKAMGIITQVVRLGHFIVETDFIVCETLAAEVVLGAAFMDKCVEAILPRKKSVELIDGSTVPIVRKPWGRPPTAPPLPDEHRYRKDHGRDISKDSGLKALLCWNQLCRRGSLSPLEDMEP